MHNMYTPENVVVSIAGNISETFIKEVEALFGSYEGGKREKVEEIPIFHMNQISRKKETEQAIFVLVLKVCKLDMKIFIV